MKCNNSKCPYSNKSTTGCRLSGPIEECWNSTAYKKEKFKSKRREKSPELKAFNGLREKCPWKKRKVCAAISTYGTCCMTNCAVWHFTKGAGI